MDHRVEHSEHQVSESSSSGGWATATGLPCPQPSHDGPCVDRNLTESARAGRFSAREVIRKLDFMVFVLVAAALSYVSYTYLSGRYGNDEVRDRWFFVSLPVIAELSFWCGRGVSRLGWRRDSEPTESLFSRSGLDTWLYLIPVAVCGAAFLLAAPVSKLGVGIVLFLVVYQFLRDRVPALRWLEVVEIPVSIYLFLKVFSLMVLMSVKDEHHWAFFLGPAQAVFEGGHLLWSVPSQYGFLNILTIANLAKFLGVDPVDSMGIVLVTMQCIAAALTVCVFRFRLGFTTIGSTLLAVAVQLCLPGWIETYAGPAFAPSTSAMRFLPAAVALLSVGQAVRLSSNAWSLGASVLVAIACLWSPESCLYTVAPLSGFAVLSFLSSPSLSIFTGVIARTCVLAVVVAGTFLGAYARTLPRGLDLHSFYEFAEAYSTHAGVLPIELNGWTSLFILLVSASYFVARNQFAKGGRESCQGALLFGYIMCVGTYFVARSAYRNVHNITPWVLLCVAALVTRRNSSEWKAQRALVFVVCSFAMVEFLSLYGGDNRNAYLERSGSPRFYVPPKFDQIPAQIAAAAHKATNSNKFTFIHDRAIFARSAELDSLGNALPISPLLHFVTPQPDRVRLYVRRMLEETPDSYVICETRVCPGVPYAFREMGDIIEVSEVPFEYSERWTILRLRRKQDVASN